MKCSSGACKFVKIELYKNGTRAADPYIDRYVIYARQFTSNTTPKQYSFDNIITLCKRGDYNVLNR